MFIRAQFETLGKANLAEMCLILDLVGAPDSPLEYSSSLRRLLEDEAVVAVPQELQVQVEESLQQFRGDRKPEIN